MTLFAFDEGQGLSEHTAPFDGLVQVLGRNAAITVAGVRHEVRDGQAILLPGGVPHALDAVSRFRMLPTMIQAPAVVEGSFSVPRRQPSPGSSLDRP